MEPEASLPRNKCNMAHKSMLWLLHAVTNAIKFLLMSTSAACGPRIPPSYMQHGTAYGAGGRYLSSPEGEPVALVNFL